MSDRTPQERREQIVALAKGDRGERGEQGEQGKRGLPGALARAVVYLFVVNTALIVLAYVLVSNAVHRAEAATQAAQQRQGQMIEVKLCTTLTGLARLQPPPGDPVTNPSRAFDQKLHATLSQLGPDLGCR